MWEYLFCFPSERPCWWVWPFQLTGNKCVGSYTSVLSAQKLLLVIFGKLSLAEWVILVTCWECRCHAEAQSQSSMQRAVSCCRILKHQSSDCFDVLPCLLVTVPTDISLRCQNDRKGRYLWVEPFLLLARVLVLLPCVVILCRGIPSKGWRECHCSSFCP